jgi:Sec-independent protein translocase protein TatA
MSPLEGKRVDDPPEGGLMFRLRLAARKYPVQIALVIALLVLIYPVALLISSNSDLKDSTKALQESNRQIKKSATDLKAALEAIQDNRKVLAGSSCAQANNNAKANNAQTSFFQKLIVQSAVDSKIFDDLITQVGGPPYGQRVHTAQGQAKKLETLKVPLRDCKEDVRKIEKEIEQLHGDGGKVAKPTPTPTPDG